MKSLVALAAMLTLFASGGASAAPFDGQTFVLDVPAGFDGPESKAMGPEGRVVAFTKTHPNADSAALLMISIHDMPSSLPALPAQEQGPESERYLGRFLAAMEQRRSNLASTPIKPVTLDGHPASRATWSGEREGQKLHGVMYCVVVDHQVFQLHAQDFDTAPAEDLRQAENSLEHVRFKNGR